MAFGKNFYANTNCFMGLRFCLNTRQKQTNKQTKSIPIILAMLGPHELFGLRPCIGDLLIYWVRYTTQYTYRKHFRRLIFTNGFQIMNIIRCRSKFSVFKKRLMNPSSAQTLPIPITFLLRNVFFLHFSCVLFQKLKKNTEIESRLLSLCFFNELFVCVYWLSRFHLKKNSF